MKLRQLMWPANGTMAERLFRWVSLLGGSCLLVSELLPTSHNAFPLINQLILWVGGPSLLLFPFLASHLLRQAAARRATTNGPQTSLKVAAAVLLLVGVCHVLLLGLFLLFSQIPLEFEPRTGGDSFLG